MEPNPTFNEVPAATATEYVSYTRSDAGIEREAFQRDRGADSAELNQLYLSKIVELEVANKTLEYAATYDYLTGQLNFRGLELVLEHQLDVVNRSKEPFSAVFLDIDKFKDINDRYGHDAGNEVLRELAHLLEHSVRKSDIVGRFGGDEFLIGLVDTDMDGAEAVVSTMMELTQNHTVQTNRDAITFGISAGIAQYRPGESREAFLKRADTALLDAKTAGRNCYMRGKI